MILSIFLIVLALSLLLIVLGYLTDDEPYLPIGLFFLFLLSITIMGGNLELRDGSLSEKNLTYTNGTLTQESEAVSFTYSAWDDNTSRQVGIWMAIVTFLGFILSIIQFTRRSDIRKNEF